MVVHSAPNQSEDLGTRLEPCLSFHLTLRLKIEAARRAYLLRRLAGALSPPAQISPREMKVHAMQRDPLFSDSATRHGRGRSVFFPPSSS